MVPPGFQPQQELAWHCTDLHRRECIFTLDPSTTAMRDLDDAVSCVRLTTNGNFRIVGIVHIAHVSYFVHQDSPIDQLAQRRATSVYLVDQVGAGGDGELYQAYAGGEIYLKLFKIV